MKNVGNHFQGQQETFYPSDSQMENINKAAPNM